jgi:hypothetical protein
MLGVPAPPGRITMKVSLIAAVAALALGSGTASAQYLVPHRGHYHVVPSYGGGYGWSGGYGGWNGGYGGYGGRVLVPHTTTHLDLVPHRGHYHLIPHTTTHFHSYPRYRW